MPIAQAQTKKSGRFASVMKLRDRVLEIPFVKFMMRVMGEMSKDDGTNMAASVAYYAFLALFPLVLGLIALMGIFLPSHYVQDSLFGFFRDNLPGSQDILADNIRHIIAARGALGIIGIAGLVWSGTGLLSAIGHAINRAWDIPRELQFYLKKPRDLFLTIGLGLLFFLSLAASSIFTFIPVGSIPVIGSYLVMVGIRIIGFLLVFAMLLILYKVMPNTKTRWRHIWPPTLLTAVLFEVGRTVFFYYISGFANYALVYGSLGSVIAVLIWIYYSAVIIILGAEMTAEYGRVMRGERKGTHTHLEQA